MNKVYAFAAILGLLVFQGCKDDTTDPIGGGGSGTNTKTCKLIKTTSDDGSTTELVWVNNQLTKVIEKDSFDTQEMIFSYDGSKLLNVVDGTDIYTMNYTGNNITSVLMTEDGENSMKSDVEYNTAGKISKVSISYWDGTEWTLYETYELTWTGDNVTKSINKYDDDDDGTLESEASYTLSMYDDKMNPYYGLPLMWLNLDSPLNYSKNNAGKMSGTLGGFPIEITQSMEYNSDGYPSKVTTTVPFFGTSVTTLSYNCQ